ncbi:hypothetical protein DE146DRAFT_642076 [Phaeosphaeria sp. MPI-PUGE-AT-0046c]|nr:hypothetical protein DE146DRAFT_642076 [Phaeosphaeria sp. MPI-PUGE-AT-0046c]
MQVDLVKRTSLTKPEASSNADSDAPTKKKANESHAGQIEGSEATSPEAAAKQRTSLKSPKEPARDFSDTASATTDMREDEKPLDEASEQSPAPGRNELCVEEDAGIIQEPAAAAEPMRDDDEIELEDSANKDYDMQERLSNAPDSPVEAYQIAAHPSPRPSKNPVSNQELMSLASNLMPSMHIGHDGPATRTRKPAPMCVSGYHGEQEDEGEEEEEVEPTPVVTKKKRSGTANRKSLPAAKKARTQPSKKRVAIGTKSEQRLREKSEAGDEEADDGDALEAEMVEVEKKVSTPENASKPASTPHVVTSKAPAKSTKILRAPTKFKPKASITIAAPESNDYAEEADVEPIPTLAAANNEEDFEPTPTPAPVPAPVPAPAKRSSARKSLPKPGPKPPATATPPLFEAPKKNKFGFSSAKPSPKKTRGQVAKDAAEAGEAKGKSGAKGSAKGKAKASAGAEEGPKTRGAAKKEKRSLRSGG